METNITLGEDEGVTQGVSENPMKSPVIFDGDSWKEMSRPENYVFYKRNLNKETPNQQQISPKNERWVLAALLALFVPIFSIEFFFALSRQLLCGGGGNGLFSPSDFAQFLCSPANIR